MTDVEHFDILVLGSGKGGKTLAMDQAKAGKKVALVEQGAIGGASTSVACIPTKTLASSARVVFLMDRAESFGVTFLAASMDMAAVAARTGAVVTEMIDADRDAIRMSGLDLIVGHGRFVAPRLIEVATEGGERHLTADHICLNLGTKAAIPLIPGLDQSVPLTHVEALVLEQAPRSLIILGSGPNALELAQAFQRLGTAVTLLEPDSRLALHEDPDVAAAIRDLLDAEGVQILLDARVSTVEGRSGQSVRLTLDDGRVLSAAHLLVVAGRTPLTAGIGLDLAGVQLDDQGFIKVDDRLRTMAADIWAIGEVAGSPMCTHASLDDFRVVKSALEGGTRTTAGRLVPSCIFLDPEFARVGLNETEAKAQGLGYRLAQMPMEMVPRARTLSERQGFMKALVADDGRILGFAMLGAGAGDVMTVVQMTMLGNLPFTALRDGIIAHPTLAEGLNILFDAL